MDSVSQDLGAAGLGGSGSGSPWGCSQYIIICCIIWGLDWAEGATSKMAHSHSCRVWLPNQTLGQTLSSSPYGPLCRVFGFPYGMVAGFQARSLKRQKGSGSCQLLRTRSGNRHSFVFTLKSTHQVVLEAQLLGESLDPISWWEMCQRILSPCFQSGLEDDINYNCSNPGSI